VTTIADSPTGQALAQFAPMTLRTRVYIHRHGLTRALANGARPSAGPELALRADQLTSPRHRKALVRTLRRTVTDSHQPMVNPFRVALIRRSAVLEAEGAIRTMIRRLDAPEPVDAEGMAMADQIVTNADRSPLYTRSEPGALRRQIRVATEALDPW
jgi:hypothetical protein